MIRVMGLVFCLALWALNPQGAQAQSVKLKPDEIRALLTGNTAIGRWAGSNYRQFFGADVVTIFAQEGARSARGQWRVEDTRQEFQSIWPGDTEWEGWFVMEYGGTFYWVSRATPPTPFRVVEGQQLVKDGDAAPQFCAVLEDFVNPEKQAEITLQGDDVPPPTCATSRSLSGGRSQHCHWAFSYRSARATQVFEQTSTAIAACLETAPTRQTGAQVNHPDSYDQRIFEAGTCR